MFVNVFKNTWAVQFLYMDTEIITENRRTVKIVPVMKMSDKGVLFRVFFLIY
jgi:hypothetical protein